jgi:hypothetical protein
MGKNNAPRMIHPKSKTAMVTTIALPETFGFSE